jgi:hypothetical protein
LTTTDAKLQNLFALMSNEWIPSPVKEESGMAIQRSAKKPQAVRKAVRATKKPTRQAAKSMPRSGDYQDVCQVLSRYCFALDRGRFEDLGPLFHRDAIFSVSFENGQKHTGRETIQAWYERFFQQRPGRYRHMRHKIYEPLVTINGNAATTATYFDADSVDQEGKIYVITGRYDDSLVKENGQWFFHERTITVFYHYSPGNGQEGM